ncbi:MAG: hypothetical protein M1305_07000 [Candidatus Marsarchaeota archaeon]|nr:hypothetical protein [Candidatus Marsarchaeota archaeon]
MTKTDLLKEAIRDQRKIPSRSEDLRSLDMDAELYVEGPKDDIVMALSGTANQLLFGRRGTGKTMILRKLLRDGRPVNPKSDYVAVFIQSEDFLRSPDVIERDPVLLRARVFFREFLHQFADRMLRMGDSILRDQGLLDRLGFTNRARREIFTERLLQLVYILQHGVSIPDLHRSMHIQDSRTDDRKKSETQTGSSLSLGIRPPVGGEFGLPVLIARGGIGLGTTDDQAHAESTSDCWWIQSQSDMGIPEIRTLLQDLVSMLKVNQIMILLDEWQALRECQAEFAEHLKACFFGLNCVSVKIAAYRHTCKFSNGGTRDNFRGLELGQDIAVVGDTDIFPSAAETVPFLYQVLYRRLLLAQPYLQTYYGPPETFDHLLLVHDLFVNPHAGEMMVKGSHGISRDFINAFNEIARQTGNDLARQKASLDLVNRVYGELSREVQGNVHAADDVGGLLFEGIKPTVQRTGAQFFFVPRNDHKWDEFLWELVEKRAIHPLSPRDLPAGAEVEWQGYEVSYGLFHEWRRAAAFSKIAQDDHFRWQDPKRVLKEKSLNGFVLDMRQNPHVMRICTFCKQQFSTAEHCFVVARLCPHCYNKQPSEISV